uniref:Uncharacterized protein n=1 Tax=Anguilla anguilla TaxID=7936 RepID=A0A0E9SFM7_ANGAN
MLTFSKQFGRYTILPIYALAGWYAPYQYSTESLALFRVPYRNNCKDPRLSALKNIHFCTF